MTMLSAECLRCEYKRDPMGIDASAPRLSWLVRGRGRGLMQGAYRLQVAGSPDALGAESNLLWDSGRVESDQSILVPYGGPSVSSRVGYYWRVQLWDQTGEVGPWSETARWEMGLLAPSDWQARWITPDLDQDANASQPSPYPRKGFSLCGQVRQARAYVSGLGLYELEINGQRVGDQALTPGWTSYDKRDQYQTYDVTYLLRSGENAVGAVLGDGWYRGYLGFAGERNTYGDRALFLLQLEVTMEDDTVVTVVSDASWRATTGPLLLTDIYHGEQYDARLEMPGWSAPGFDDGGWASVSLAEYDGALVAPQGPPIRCIEAIRPIEIIQTPKGETVFDFGQNMIGWLRLRVEGPAGTMVRLHHAEVLDQEGNFYTTNLRSARQELVYTLKGEGVEVYEPRFTFMGFRYARLEGYPGEPTLDCLTGMVVHSDMRPSGSFTCDKPLHNQLQHNIVWGQKGNFLDVPTDCPQRDERLGWTGDAQVFCRTAAFNMDVAGFFDKWLADVSLDQCADGSVPHVIPDVLGRKGQASGSAAWGDAAAIVPWTMYLCYGDADLLRRQYPSMVRWVEYIRDRAGGNNLWQTGFHFGDWLAILGPNPLMPQAVTATDLIATAYYAYSTEIVAKTARVLGLDEDAAEYEGLLERIRGAFRDEYLSPRGRLSGNTQTAYVLALMFDLLPQSCRGEAAARLAEDVRSHGNHLTTGFVGASYLCHVLSRFGYLDVAYALVNQETYPSWLYPVKQGATTIWERWDGIRPDGSFQDAGMNSFNHYAYGAIGEWLYRVAAGLDVDPAAPGYKHAIIAPQPGGGFGMMRAALETPYGALACEWHVVDDAVAIEVSVPDNTWATVRLPLARLEQVTESGACLVGLDGLRTAYQEGDDVVLDVGSGSYELSYVSPELGKRVHASTKPSLEWSIAQLMAHEGAQGVLERHLSELVQGPMMMWLQDQTLPNIAQHAPDRLPQPVLDTVAKELSEL